MLRCIYRVKLRCVCELLVEGRRNLILRFVNYKLFIFVIFVWVFVNDILIVGLCMIEC